MEFIEFQPVELGVVRDALHNGGEWVGVTLDHVYIEAKVFERSFCPLIGTTYIKRMKHTVKGSLCKGLFIRKIAVREGQRRKGLAIEMINWIIEQALELDCQFVRVEAVISEAMLKLATKLNFQTLPLANGNSLDLVL